MKKLLPRAAVGGSAILALGLAGALAVASIERGEAGAALEASVAAHRAERAVVEAQGRVTRTDVSAALASIRHANVAGGRVGVLTERLVVLLEDTLGETTRAVGSARTGAEKTLVARRETGLAADLLAAIADYQSSASSSAEETNRALREILEALRDTNRGFPGSLEPLR